MPTYRTRPVTPVLQASHPDAQGLVVFATAVASGQGPAALTDFSTYRHAATNIGGVNRFPATAYGPSGRAVRLDLTSISAITAWQFGSGPETQVPNYTWMIRLMADVTPSGAGVTQPVQYSNGNQFSFAWDHNNASFRLGATHNVGGSFPVAKLTSSLVGGVWYDLAATYDGTNIRAYVWGPGTSNGLEATTAAGTPTPLTGILGLGGGGSGQVWAGAVEYYAVWNRALSADRLARQAADPWRIVRPASRPSPVRLSAGPGVVANPAAMIAAM